MFFLKATGTRDNRFLVESSQMVIFLKNVVYRTSFANPPYREPYTNTIAQVASSINHVSSPTSDPATSLRYRLVNPPLSACHEDDTKQMSSEKPGKKVNLIYSTKFVIIKNMACLGLDLDWWWSWCQAPGRINKLPVCEVSYSEASEHRTREIF